MSARYITNSYEIANVYNKISINAKEANVKIELSSDDITKLFFFEDKKRPYTFEIVEDTLIIKLAKSKWYNLLRVGFKRSEINVSIPKIILEAIHVKANVGFVDVSSIICNGNIDVTTNTGNLNIYDVSCQSFNSKVNTGNITLEKLNSTDSITVKSNTGKVLLNDCISKEYFIKNNTGSVCGKLPSGTIFEAKSNTGKIELPKLTIGEVITAKCEVKTNTGKIKFE